MDALIKLVIIVAILIALWFVVERFSPDPLITKLCQIALFICALLVAVKMLLPMVGVSF